jgi:hypothetical protein
VGNGHTALRLADGSVLIAGGEEPPLSPGGPESASAAAELFLPATGERVPLNLMVLPRLFPRASLLGSGAVLITGGFETVYDTLDAAEIFQLAASVP